MAVQTGRAEELYGCLRELSPTNGSKSQVEAGNYHLEKLKGNTGKPPTNKKKKKPTKNVLQWMRSEKNPTA